MPQADRTDAAGRLFREGRLSDAVEAANAAIRAAPGALAPRILLAELLLFAGNLERADVVLDACAGLDAGVGVVVAEFRQVLRAEVARRQVFRDARLPEFLGEPTATQRATLAALVALRGGDAREAGRLAAQAEEARARAPGTMEGRGAFDDFRDGDDLLAGTFEVLTTTGKYFWVPVERVATLVFHAPKRPRDLFWRRATMAVTDGPDGEVYLPVTYAADQAGDEHRLGRATDWVRAGEDGPVRGVGARTFLVGEEGMTLLEMSSLAFGAAP